MFDLTKCTGGKCPAKNKCWRYKYPSKHTHHWYISPSDEKPCPFFIPIHKETQKFIDEEKNGLL